MVISLCVIYNI